MMDCSHPDFLEVIGRDGKKICEFICEECGSLFFPCKSDNKAPVTPQHKKGCLVCQNVNKEQYKVKKKVNRRIAKSQSNFSPEE